MRRSQWLQALRPGIGIPANYDLIWAMESIATGRLFVATVIGSLAVLILGRVTQSSVTGYAYGALLFTVVSWPYVPRLIKTVRWTDMTIVQSVLVLVASLTLGDAAQRILGFNPQASGMKQMNWMTARHLLWQFPLVLPVENLLLVGAMAWLWKFLRPNRSVTRIAVSVLSAALFGLWHVPFWGIWTMWTIGMSVLPWVIYMIMTGDIIAPLIAHILMDTIAVILSFGPHDSLIVRLFWPLLGTSLILLGLGYAVYQDWCSTRRKTI